MRIRFYILSVSKDWSALGYDFSMRFRSCSIFFISGWIPLAMKNLEPMKAPTNVSPTPRRTFLLDLTNSMASLRIPLSLVDYVIGKVFIINNGWVKSYC